MVVAALGLSSCGGDSGSSPTAVRVPVTTTVAEGSGSIAGAACTATISGGRLIITCPGPPTSVTLQPFTTTSTGRVEFILDWTSASNDLDAVLSRDSTQVGRTTSTTTKPERLVLENLPAGTYTPSVMNYATAQESFSYQILFTS